MSGAAVAARPISEAAPSDPVPFNVTPSDVAPFNVAPSNVVPFERPKRSFGSSRILMAVAAAAAIVIVVLSVQVATRPPSRAGDLAAAYDHAVTSGHAIKVSLQPDLGRGAVTAEVAWQADGTGFVRNLHLSTLPPGKTYQLWATFPNGTGQTAISAGVLGPYVTNAAFHISGAPSGFAITVEETPGVVASRNAPVAIGALPSPLA